MFLLNGKKINIDAPITSEEGITYANLRNPEIRNQLGVIEQPDPIWPEPADEFFVTENEDGSLNITRKSDEQLAEIRLAKAKIARQQTVSEIIVTTQAGNAFDGHEDAQNRMGRSVTIMTEADTLPWVLADNSIALVTKAELQEALRLAGLAMAEIWVKPYTD